MTNETLNVLKTRRSCRKFKPDMITEEELNAVLEAGTYAPSGHGAQSPILVAVSDVSTRQLLSHLNSEILKENGAGGDADPFFGAPVIVVVLADADCPTAIEDGSLAIGNMLNAAASLGLGGCWVHRARQEFEGAIGKAMLLKWGVKGNYIGVGHCVLGYPAAPAAPAKPRKQDYIRMIRAGKAEE